MNRLQLLPALVLFTVLAAHTAQAETIYDIQYTTDPSGDSPYVGQTVTITGIVTGTYFYGYLLAEAPGPWHAIHVYSQSHGPQLGDEIEITGTVAEYGHMTELADITSFTVLSTGNEIAPSVVNALDAQQEMYESVLITVSDVVTTAVYSTGEWVVQDGSADLRCADLTDYTYFPQTGDALDSVTGILLYMSGMFKLGPRFTLDIAGEVIPHFALGGDLVTMNAALDVLEGAYVEIHGDRILGITSSPPPDVSVIETNGLIFPGLIDAHNHPRYNVLDLIPFGETFEDRYEWRETETYSNFSTQFNAIRDYPSYYGQIMNLLRMPEVRALTAGTTTIQGSNCNDPSHDFYAHQGMILNNAERFPSRIYHDTFPLTSGQGFWNDMQQQFCDRFVIHLSEGISEAAVQEFYTWMDWGMLDWRTTIIHGVPFEASEWELMAAADAHLVWSPMSDVFLYGVSPDIPGALTAGVNVALAPDWTESGTRNMLAELKFANELNHTLWGGVIEPAQLAQFVTRNAADAMGAAHRIGQIAAGFQADLMVIPGSLEDPYQALLDAEPAGVMLTVVSGRPMYGDGGLMSQFSFLDPLDEIAVCGHPKVLAIQIDAYHIPDSDKPIADVIAELQEAYDQASPQTCDFLGPFDCEPGEVVDMPEVVGWDLRMHPNPLRTAATFNFTLPERKSTNLTIFDVTGAVVRTIVSQSLDPGTHALIWDGRDDSGRPVTSGIYTARLSAGDQVQGRGVLVAR